MNKEQVRKEIRTLRYNYVKAQIKAQNRGDELIAMQFAGSIVALDILSSNLGLDDEEDEED